ncbi:hypothetical protein P9112_010760 [Eukaryota sp. TZLM1-RC]
MTSSSSISKSDAAAIIASLLTENCTLVDRFFSAIDRSLYGRMAQCLACLLREGLTPLLTKLLRLEIDIPNIATFLRGNSVAPKLISAFVTELGKSFLASLNPILQDIIDIPHQLHISDSHSNQTEAKYHFLQVINHASLIADTLVALAESGSIHRAICAVLSSINDFLLTQNNLPEITRTAILGGIVMLRLVSPHLVSFNPSSSSPLPTISRNNLVTVAKLLQSLASSHADFKMGYTQELTKLRSTLSRFIKLCCDDHLGLDFADLYEEFVFDPGHVMVSRILGEQSTLQVNNSICDVFEILSKNASSIILPFFDAPSSPSLSWSLYTLLHHLKNPCVTGRVTSKAQEEMNLDNLLYEPLCKRIVKLNTDYHDYYTVLETNSTQKSPIYMSEGIIYCVVRLLIEVNLPHPTDFVSLCLKAIELDTFEGHQSIVIDFSGASFIKSSNYLKGFLTAFLSVIPSWAVNQSSVVVVLASPLVQSKLISILDQTFHNISLRFLGWGLQGTLIGLEERLELRQMSLLESSKQFSTTWFDVLKRNRHNKHQKRLLKPTPCSLLNLTCESPPVVCTELSWSHLSFEPRDNSALALVLTNSNSNVPGKWLKKDQEGERILDFDSAEERDLMIEQLEKFKSNFDDNFQHIFEVSKVNSVGKVQKRTLIVSTDSLLNVDKKSIKWEEPLASLESVTVNNNLVLVKFFHADLSRKFLCKDSLEAETLKKSLSCVCNSVSRIGL